MVFFSSRYTSEREQNVRVEWWKIQFWKGEPNKRQRVVIHFHLSNIRVQCSRRNDAKVKKYIPPQNKLSHFSKTTELGDFELLALLPILRLVEYFLLFCKGFGFFFCSLFSGSLVFCVFAFIGFSRWKSCFFVTFFATHLGNGYSKSVTFYSFLIWKYFQLFFLLNYIQLAFKNLVGYGLLTMKKHYFCKRIVKKSWKFGFCLITA